MPFYLKARAKFRDIFYFPLPLKNTKHFIEHAKQDDMHLSLQAAMSKILYNFNLFNLEEVNSSNNKSSASVASSSWILSSAQL